jgi:DnaJ-class molecular chaperone
MKARKRKAPLPEVECPACNGTGFPPVAQPTQPEKKIYPAPCKQCLGKGRLATAKQ